MNSDEPTVELFLKILPKDFHPLSLLEYKELLSLVSCTSDPDQLPLFPCPLFSAVPLRASIEM
jgi:hypothetical protein